MRALLLVALLGACGAPKRYPPIATAPSLSDGPIPHVSAMCLPHAFHAMAAALPPGAPTPERKKIAFENYVNAFVDAEGQRRYVACLEGRGVGLEAKRKAEEALADLKRLDDAVDGLASRYPAGRRIVEAEETFTNLNARRGRRTVEIVFADGKHETLTSDFDRLPPK